jgi:hypothetical protein
MHRKTSCCGSFEKTKLKWPFHRVAYVLHDNETTGIERAVTIDYCPLFFNYFVG